MRKTLLMLAVLSVLSPSAHAQDPQLVTPDLPPLDARAMDGKALQADEPVRLTPEGPAVIKLSEDAASVIIGNPAHATAMLENPRLIMLMPGQPGATKVMALDRNGRAIFSRHVLVGGTPGGHLRVTRVCATSTAGGCKPVSMYYCPDKCYETAIPESTVVPGATGDVSKPVEESTPAAPAGQPAESTATPDSFAPDMGVVQ